MFSCSCAPELAHQTTISRGSTQGSHSISTVLSLSPSLSRALHVGQAIEASSARTATREIPLRFPSSAPLPLLQPLLRRLRPLLPLHSACVSRSALPRCCCCCTTQSRALHNTPPQPTHSHSLSHTHAHTFSLSLTHSQLGHSRVKYWSLQRLDFVLLVFYRRVLFDSVRFGSIRLLPLCE